MSSSLRIKAVVFDVDGTLLDTREFIAQAFEHTLRTFECAVPGRQALMDHVAGRTLKECYPALAPGHSYADLSDTHREFQLRSFHLIRAYEGLHEFLVALRAAGMRLGVCSSRAKTLKPSLQHVQALKYFDAVIDASEVVNHKPHPEGVLRVLELLSTDPGEAAMVGDTVVDIETGKNAGCALSIGVTHGFGTRGQLTRAGADFAGDSLDEVEQFLLR